jgi:hypothetical protein
MVPDVGGPARGQRTATGWAWRGRTVLGCIPFAALRTASGRRPPGALPRAPFGALGNVHASLPGFQAALGDTLPISESTQKNALDSNKNWAALGRKPTGQPAHFAFGCGTQGADDKPPRIKGLNGSQ